MIPFLVGFMGLTLWLASSVADAAGPPVVSDTFKTQDGDLVIRPIHHATLALQWKGQTFLVDPVGGAARFQDLPRPDLILVTDVHGDHLDPATLQAVATHKTTLIAPPAVAEQLPPDLRRQTTVLSAGEAKALPGLNVEAVAAYNLHPERQKFHPKGRGNGYVITLGNRRVYLSGDTEDVPEMRTLKNIDLAFVCMNLPYTMTVDQAANAVRAFRPKIVYPYHCRGSDLEQFKKLVADDPEIEVRVRDWYRP
jgi:L-ascorbate metabolism protein UlaG (beta-lactamase superfamily)